MFVNHFGFGRIVSKKHKKIVFPSSPWPLLLLKSSFLSSFFSICVHLLMRINVLFWQLLFGAYRGIARFPSIATHNTIQTWFSFFSIEFVISIHSLFFCVRGIPHLGRHFLPFSVRRRPFFKVTARWCERRSFAAMEQFWLANDFDEKWMTEILRWAPGDCCIIHWFAFAWKMDRSPESLMRDDLEKSQAKNKM